MVLGGPRSGTTWAANWLTTDTTFCLHDPLLEYTVRQLNNRHIPNRRLGISCTASILFPEWVNAQKCPKIFLYRDIEEINQSLARLGLVELEKLKHLGRIDGVGLDSSEVGHPPGDFTRVFRRCRELGLRAVAHAGEEGPAAYITEALDHLQVERIDHGVRAPDDPALVARLAQAGTALTVCPLSNLKLRVFPSLAEHNLKRMLDAGLRVTVNSDDPAYFGGYIAENFRAVAEALELSRADLATLARHSLEASFVTDAERAPWLVQLAALAGA